MIELLNDLELLRQPRLQLATLALCGVGFGSQAAAFPHERVVEVTLSPIVRSLQFDKDNDKPKLYLDGQGDPIPLRRVVESVLEQGDGVLHFADDVSFGIERGAVARFSLYGRALSHWHGVSQLRELLLAFGQPDKLVRTEANGDTMFFDAYYESSRKWLRWDDRWQRLVFIALGGSRDDVRAGNFGGIVRRDVPV